MIYSRESKQMSEVHLVILQAKDGALLPIAAYNDKDRANNHAISCNYRAVDEFGSMTISPAELLGCFAWVKTMAVV